MRPNHGDEQPIATNERSNLNHFINLFEFSMVMRKLRGLRFEVMLEAKDLALPRLRKDLACCAPDVAPLFEGAAADQSAG